MIIINTFLLAYKSVTQVDEMTVYFSGLVSAGLSFRCVLLFIKCIDDEMTYKEAFISGKKRIMGAFFAITITGLIAFYRGFF